MRELPAHATAQAFKAANGEYAWKRADVATALGAISASGQAVLGGEVWVVTKGRRLGLVPSSDGQEPPRVWHWDTAEQERSEPWREYCARTAAESNAVVNAMRVEDYSRQDVRDHLFFNLTFVDENDA